MTQKGMSPLIAAVILIAIVMSIAFVISGFLSDMVRQREHEAIEGAERTMECAEINLEVRTGSINEHNDDLTFLLTNRNNFRVVGLRVATYDDDGDVEMDLEPEPSHLEPLETAEITVNETVDEPNRIEIRNMYCPNFEIAMVKEYGEWGPDF